MHRTLGDLVDALVTTSMKLWHVQDQVHKAGEAGEGLDAETVAKLRTLNLQRNRLMTALDETLDRAVGSGKADVDPRVKIL